MDAAVDPVVLRGVVRAGRANGFGNWVPAAVIIIVGVGAAYPFIADGGPASPWGCAIAGLILWLFAPWALKPMADLPSAA